MAKVNISAKFGKDTSLYNGLGAMVEDLLDDPTTVRTAVVSYAVGFSKRDFANGGAETPTIRIMQIEPLEGSAAESAKKLQRKAFQARTGNPMQEPLFPAQDAGGEAGGEADDEGED